MDNFKYKQHELILHVVSREVFDTRKKIIYRGDLSCLF